MCKKSQQDAREILSFYKLCILYNSNSRIQLLYKDQIKISPIIYNFAWPDILTRLPISSKNNSPPLFES